MDSGIDLLQKRPKLELKIPVYTPAAFLEQIVITWISMDLAFQKIENPQLCVLLHMLQSEVNIPCRIKLKTLVTEQFFQTLTNLRTNLLEAPSKISLALNC